VVGWLTVVSDVDTVRPDVAGVPDHVEAAQFGCRAVGDVRGVVECAVLGEPAINSDGVAGAGAAVRLDVTGGAELEVVKAE
jgi:hypothetical protein